MNTLFGMKLLLVIISFQSGGENPKWSLRETQSFIRLNQIFPVALTFLYDIAHFALELELIIIRTKNFFLSKLTFMKKNSCEMVGLAYSHFAHRR